jgi:hypothetical protein
MMRISLEMAMMMVVVLVPRAPRAFVASRVGVAVMMMMMVPVTRVPRAQRAPWAQQGMMTMENLHH